MKKALISSSVVLLAVVGYFYINSRFVVGTTSINSRVLYEQFINQHAYYTQLWTARKSSPMVISGALPPDRAYMQDFLLTMDPNLKYPTPFLLYDLNDETAAIRDGNLKSDRHHAKSISEVTEWKTRGPLDVAGRTRALMFDPNDPTSKKVWAGGVSGGLWFNRDITKNNEPWEKVNDFWDNLAVTCIAFDPNDKKVFYVGTGEFQYDVRGGGIWKTTDSGNTWSRLASTTNFLEIRDIVVRNEGGQSVVYVAVRPGFGLDSPTYTAGLYRSADGGSSWTQVLPFAQGSSQYTNLPSDIEIGPDNTLWVGTGKHWWVNSAMSTIYKSTTGLPGSWIEYSSFSPSNLNFSGQIKLSVSPSTATVVFAAIEQGGKIGGIFKSLNAGNSWVSLALPVAADLGIPSEDFTRGQGWYDLIIKVHPANNDFVLIGGIDLFRSVDGGNSWTQISKWSNNPNMNLLNVSFVHADQHNIVFRPGFPNDVIISNDGGVFYTGNLSGATTSSVFSARNYNYNVTQFYTGAIHPTLTDYMLGGTQDNGTQKFFLPGFENTVWAYGGDGAICFIDQLEPNFQIVSYVYNNYYLSTNGGSNFNIKLLEDDKTGLFINKGDYDSYTKTLYTGRNATSIYRIRNVTTTRNVDSIKVNLGSMATAFRVSPYANPSSTLYVGTASGRLFKLSNASTTTPVISEITGSLFPQGSISSIAFGETEKQILVTFYNYGIINIWETRDGGVSWVVREGNLPNMPVRWAEYHPLNTNQVYIATELGVWSTDNINVSNPVWNSTNGGLANVRTDMLQVRKSDGVIMAATHGRGVFTATMPAELPQTITFKDVPQKKYGDAPFKVYAKASSGLAISSYTSSNPNVVTITDSTVTVVAPGSAIITAKQDGNGYFKPATATLNLQVLKGDQTISFAPLQDRTLGDAAFTLEATASSGLPVSFKSSSNKLTISGNTANIVSAGKVTVTASQAGNNLYNAAPNIDNAFCIKPVKPQVTQGESGESIVLTSSSNTGNQWFINGIAIQGATGKTFTAIEPGVYQVQVQVDDCKSEFSNGVPLIITGDVNYQQASWVVYPNPVVDYFLLSFNGFSNSKQINIQVINTLGAKVITQEVWEADKILVDMSAQERGLYIVRITQDKKVENIRILKK